MNSGGYLHPLPLAPRPRKDQPPLIGSLVLPHVQVSPQSWREVQSGGVHLQLLQYQWVSARIICCPECYSRSKRKRKVYWFSGSWMFIVVHAKLLKVFAIFLLLFFQLAKFCNTFSWHSSLQLLQIWGFQGIIQMVLPIFSDLLFVYFLLWQVEKTCDRLCTSVLEACKLNKNQQRKHEKMR